MDAGRRWGRKTFVQFTLSLFAEAPTYRPYRWFVSWLPSCFDPDDDTSAGCECELRTWCGWTEGNKLVGENLPTKRLSIQNDSSFSVVTELTLKVSCLMVVTRGKDFGSQMQLSTLKAYAMKPLSSPDSTSGRHIVWREMDTVLDALDLRKQKKSYMRTCRRHKASSKCPGKFTMLATEHSFSACT